MNTFENREAAYENRFAHEAELEFRLAARRNRLVGEWAAAHLGLGEDATVAYAKSIVATNLEEPGDEDIVRKLVADLAAVGIGEDAIRAQIGEAAIVARQQIEGA